MDRRHDDIITQLIAWGEDNTQVRVMLLTSSLVANHAPVDVLSDLDVHMFVADPSVLTHDMSWHRLFGSVLVKCCPGWEAMGIWQDSHLLLYEDGTKIDFTIAPLDLLHRIHAADTLPDFLDVGYRVLLDKDGLAAGLPIPTHRAYIPAKPSAEDYADFVNGFWWDSTYVVKYLWRDDLLVIKCMLEHTLIQQYLRQMLEWSIEMDREWNWKPGKYGRYLTKALDPATRQELVACYAGADIDDLWESLFRTVTFFRKTAIRVGENLGYRYPHDLDARVMAYHRAVRGLDRQTTDHGELSSILREELSLLMRT